MKVGSSSADFKQYSFRGDNISWTSVVWTASIVTPLAGGIVQREGQHLRVRRDRKAFDLYWSSRARAQCAV